MVFVRSAQWKKWVKRLASGIVVTALLMALLLAAGRLWLTSLPARQLIQTRIDEAIPGAITWDGLDLSLLAGHIEIRNLKIAGPSGDEVIFIERVAADFAWRALLRGELAVDAVTIDRPRVWLGLDPDGELNLLEAFPPPAPDTDPASDGIPFNITIHALTLSSGSFQFEMPDPPDAPEQITLHGIDITASGGDLFARSARFALRIARGEMDMAGIRTAFTPSRFDGALDQGGLHSASIEIGSRLGHLSVSGGIRDLFAPLFYDLDATLTTSLPQLEEAFQLSQKWSGPLALHLALKGTIDNPEARLDATYGGGKIEGTRVDRATLACGLKERQLAIRSLELESPMGRAAATGEVDLREAFPDGFTEESDVEAIRYAVRLTQSGTSLGTLPGNEDGVTGEVASTLSLNGVGISPKTLTAHARLDMSAKNLALESTLTPFDLTAHTEASLSANRLAVKTLTLASGATRIKATGGADLASGAVEATLSLAAPELSRLMVAPVAAHLAGALSGTVALGGSLTHPVVDARFAGERLAVDGVPVGTLRLHAGLDHSGTLTIREMALKNNGSLVTAGGTVQLLKNGLSPDLTSDLTLAFQQVRAEDYQTTVPLKGTVEGLLTCRGPLLFPTATLTLQGRGLAAGATRIGDADATLRLDNGLLTLDTVRVQNESSELTLTGTARLLDAASRAPLANPTFEANLGGEGLFLEDFADGMHGKLAVSARLEGDAASPRGEFTVTGHALDFGVQTLQELTLAAGIGNGRVSVDSLKVALTKDDEISATGWLSLPDRRYALRVAAPDISLASIEAIREQTAAQGRLALAVTGEGSLDTPRLHGELAVTQLRVNGEPFKDGALQVDIKEQMATLAGTLVGDIKGWLNLSTLDFSATAKFPKTRLTPFFTVAGRKDLSGTLTGLIEAEGNAASLETIRARADVSQLTVTQNGTTLASDGVLHASFANGEYLVPQLRLTLLDQGHIEIQGKGTLAGAIDFNADGAIPLEAVAIFTDELRNLTGEVALSASATGTLDHPALQAVVDLNDLGFTVPVLEQTLHSVTGRLRVTPDAVTAEELGGYLDKGRFDLSGTLGLADVAPVTVDARLTAHALTLSVPDTLEILLNGDLALAGTPENAAIIGDIELLEGRYVKDVTLNLLDNLATPTREETPATPRPTTPFLASTELDITIRHRSPFVVDNNVALMALKPSLKIYGTLDAPLVSGRAEVESGTLTYLGKEFEIKKGVIDFLNPYRIEPTLDIESQVDVRTWSLFLNVTGVVDNLKFTMSSTPAESNEDILSLLAFGKTTDELIKGDGGSSLSPKQLLANVIARTLQGSLKEATGLDTLEMKFTERTDPAASDDVSITVGKEISRRMTVKYGVETKNGVTVQTAVSEYKFYENVLMNAFQDTLGDFGGELMFRLEFR